MTLALIYSMADHLPRFATKRPIIDNTHLPYLGPLHPEGSPNFSYQTHVTVISTGRARKKGQRPFNSTCKVLYCTVPTTKYVSALLGMWSSPPHTQNFFSAELALRHFQMQTRKPSLSLTNQARNMMIGWHIAI